MRTDRRPVYLRLASERVCLDSPLMRFGTLAHVALGLAGGHVMVSQEDGPSAPRAAAFSWLLQHDRMLLDLCARAAEAPGEAGPGIVISSDVRTVAGSAPSVELAGGEVVLWAAPATCLLDPPATPPAALTLTVADADALRAGGVNATSLLAWPPAPDATRPPARVVVAAGAGAGVVLDAVLEALSSVLRARATVDVVVDAPVAVRGGRHAPLHPWHRSRVVRSSDLVLLVGRSAGAELVAAEGAAAGVRCLRIMDGPAPAFGDPFTTRLGDALPATLALGPIDAARTAGALHLAVHDLPAWLSAVAGDTLDVSTEGT